MSCCGPFGHVSPSHHKDEEKHNIPWLVPVDQPLELVFFHKVFTKLHEEREGPEEEEEDEPLDCMVNPKGVPLLVFQRAMSRLFRVLQDERQFDARHYDLNKDGTVGWWEFCVLWKEEQLSVRLSTAERIYLTLEDPQASRLGRLCSVFVLATILVSSGGFILSTLPSMQEQRDGSGAPVSLDTFVWIDTICVILFTIEYMLRLVTAAFMRMELTNQDEIIHNMCTDEVIQWPTKAQRVVSFIRSIPNLIDLVAILPSYITWTLDLMGQDQEGGSSNEVLRLIRLMRVVRAFRLGRRFEAVIIIGRAMTRSVRALWVLVLNITMTTLIFGAVMFFVEQGQYDSATGYYMRPAGTWTLDPDTLRWVEDRERSPFQSIPHSFWWALVTATTVGYGDVTPTTNAGKVCAGVAMIWSLCVLALPIGVIGTHFETVWQEYDHEKAMERELKKSERHMVRQTLGSIDPLSFSRQFLLEIYHDSQMPSVENDIFIGEAELELELQPYCKDRVHCQRRLKLVENRTKSNRKITGAVYVNYWWTPSDRVADNGVILDGTLDVEIVKAENLVSVDWKGSGLSDPYLVATAYPDSPGKDGVVHPRKKRTCTLHDESCPQWREVLSFHFNWHQDGVLAKREVDRKSSANAFPGTYSPMGYNTSYSGISSVSITSFSGESPVASGANLEDRRLRSGVSRQSSDAGALDRRLMATLPQLQLDVADLQMAIPELHTEVRQLREGTLAILACLGVLPSRGLPGHLSGNTAPSLGGSTGSTMLPAGSPGPGTGATTTGSAGVAGVGGSGSVGAGGGVGAVTSGSGGGVGGAGGAGAVGGCAGNARNRTATLNGVGALGAAIQGDYYDATSASRRGQPVEAAVDDNSLMAVGADDSVDFGGSFRHLQVQSHPDRKEPHTATDFQYVVPGAVPEDAYTGDHLISPSGRGTASAALVAGAACGAGGGVDKVITAALVPCGATGAGATGCSPLAFAEAASVSAVGGCGPAGGILNGAVGGGTFNGSVSTNAGGGGDAAAGGWTSTRRSPA